MGPLLIWGVRCPSDLRGMHFFQRCPQMFYEAYQVCHQSIRPQAANVPDQKAAGSLLHGLQKQAMLLQRLYLLESMELIV